MTEHVSITPGGMERGKETVVQHQFGSIVLMVDVYQQELLADAARVRPIPVTRSSEHVTVTRLVGCHHRVGAALIRVGLRLQEGQPLGHLSPGPSVVERGMVA